MKAFYGWRKGWGEKIDIVDNYIKKPSLDCWDGLNKLAFLYRLNKRAKNPLRSSFGSSLASGDS